MWLPCLENTLLRSIRADRYPDFPHAPGTVSLVGGLLAVKINTGIYLAALEVYADPFPV